MTQPKYFCSFFPANNDVQKSIVTEELKEHDALGATLVFRVGTLVCSSTLFSTHASGVCVLYYLL